MSASPVLRTERLELHMPQRSDLQGLIDLIAADETRRFLGPAKPDEKAQFEKLLRNVGGWTIYGYGNFMVRLHGEDEVIGSCGVFHSWRGFGQGLDDVPEAGWIIRNDHWGKGIASEAMRAVLAWFDEAHGFRRIAAMIEEGNTASQKVAVALGFVAYGKQEYEGSPLILYERLGAG